MKSYAAIDLRGGAVVQLVGGDPGEERVRRPDPAAVAREWLDAGFRHLHVVDLDAALGTGANSAAVEAIAAEAEGRALLQVGGGLRGDEAVARALRLGADRVIVGTRAADDQSWLQRMADRYPARLAVAADVRDGVVLSRGWTHATALETEAFLAGLDDLPLAGVLVTDVAREGRQVGVDAPLFQRLTAATRHPLLAAGGIGAAADLRLLERAGAAGAVLGMALYTGRISPAHAFELEQS